MDRLGPLKAETAHPSTKTVDGKGLAVSSRNDHDMLHVISVKRFDGVPMQRDEKLAPGLLLLYPDLALCRDVRVRHSDYVGAALTQIEKKMKCRALFGAERPTSAAEVIRQTNAMSFAATKR